MNVSPKGYFRTGINLPKSAGSGWIYKNIFWLRGTHYRSNKGQRTMVHRTTERSSGAAFSDFTQLKSPKWFVGLDYSSFATKQGQKYRHGTEKFASALNFESPAALQEWGTQEFHWKGHMLSVEKWLKKDLYGLWFDWVGALCMTNTYSFSRYRATKVKRSPKNLPSFSKTSGILSVCDVSSTITAKRNADVKLALTEEGWSDVKSVTT